MPELALHILDLVQNSVSAGATRVVVTICYDTASDTLLISIEDDGRGMPPELLARVSSPFAQGRIGHTAVQAACGDVRRETDA